MPPERKRQTLKDENKKLRHICNILGRNNQLVEKFLKEKKLEENFLQWLEIEFKKFQAAENPPK